MAKKLTRGPRNNDDMFGTIIDEPKGEDVTVEPEVDEDAEETKKAKRAPAKTKPVDVTKDITPPEKEVKEVVKPAETVKRFNVDLSNKDTSKAKITPRAQKKYRATLAVRSDIDFQTVLKWASLETGHTVGDLVEAALREYLSDYIERLQ